MTPETALLILRRTMAEMPWHPKEALWIAEWLAAGQSTAFSDNRAEVDGVLESLRGERLAGVEGTT